MTFLSLLGLALVFWLLGRILESATRKTQGASENPLVEQINACLPQTQCGQCGHPGCLPYARAIVANQADIDQCPPGGTSTIRALAELLGIEPKRQNPQYGLEKKALVAIIDEPSCIGCALCLAACPVDAILGAPKYLHTVIASECTGCELCIPSCPVDCIKMETPQGEALPC